MEQSDKFYSDFFLEYEGVHTIHIPSIGIMNYKLEQELENAIEIYIRDVYISPQHRGQQHSKNLELEVIQHAELTFKKPVKAIYGTVQLSNPHKESSLRMLTAAGYKLVAANSDTIFFKKEL